MQITPDQEREFYDRSYAQHIGAPEHALVSNLQTMLAGLADPAQPVYERRTLYNTALEHLLEQGLSGKKALDYGCGTGDWGCLMATEGATVTLLDLSPVAIQLGLRRARASGVAERVTGLAREAGDLGCMGDATFDVIYASAALHHTLKYPRAMSELVRVLKPGGRLILAETYGNNQLLNWLRRLRWRISSEPVEAGEEIILSDRELQQLSRWFCRIEILPVNLLAMAKRLFRGRFTSPAVRTVIGALELADKIILRVFPFLRRYCGEVVVVAEKAGRAEWPAPSRDRQGADPSTT